jgi:hypothetical protein
LAPGTESSQPGRAGRLALYGAITIAVWGLFALDRGLWHDDVQVLFRVFSGVGRGEGLFPALASPTRRLQGLPFALALATGHPRPALELILGLVWLLSGLVAERIACELWPDRPRAAFLAACFTLAATADYFTDGLVGLGYFLAALFYLVGLWCGLAWLRRRRLAWAVAAVAAANISLWIIDVALPAWLLTPVLWWVAAGREERSRVDRLAVAWYASAIPYLVVFRGFLRHPHGYAATALVPLTPGGWLSRSLALLAYNFEPWRWAFSRPQWLAPAPTVIPFAVRLVIAALIGGAFAVLLWRERQPSESTRRWTATAGACLLLMAASNAAFASVHLAEFFCRTHVLSRVFAVLALAVVLDSARSRPARLLAAVVAVSFVALGTLGGLERQDYLAGHWRRHRQELRSIVDAAPALAPDTRIVLRLRSHDHYMATDVGYLARAWMSLAYADPSLECRVFLWSEARRMQCRPGEGALVCSGERSPHCHRLDRRHEDVMPYSQLLFFEYDPAANRYAIVPALPAEADGPGAAAYAPQNRIEPGPRSGLADNLIYGRGGLADRWWP